MNFIENVDGLALLHRSSVINSQSLYNEPDTQIEYDDGTLPQVLVHENFRHGLPCIIMVEHNVSFINICYLMM